MSPARLRQNVFALVSGALGLMPVPVRVPRLSFTDEADPARVRRTGLECVLRVLDYSHRQRSSFCSVPAPPGR